MSQNLILVHLCFALLLLNACASGDPHVEFLDCENSGKCDAAGPLRAAEKWIAPGAALKVVVVGEQLPGSDAAGAEIIPLGEERYEVRFAEEGFVELHAHDEAGAVDESSRMLIRVSARGPETILTKPERRPQVAAAGAFLEVAGRVSDPLGPLKVYIKGQQAELQEDGSFRGGYPAFNGLEELSVVAVDQAGNEFPFGGSILLASAANDQSVRSAFRLSNEGLSTFANEINRRLPSIVYEATRRITSQYVGTQSVLDIYLDGATIAGTGGLSGSVSISIQGTSAKTLQVDFVTSGTTRANIHTVGPLARRYGTVFIRDLRVSFQIRFGYSSSGMVTSVENASQSDRGISISGLGGVIDRIANSNVNKVRSGILSGVLNDLPSIVNKALSSAATRLPMQTGDTLEVDLELVWPDATGMTIGLRTRIPGVESLRNSILNIASIPGKRNFGLSLHFDAINQWLFAQWRAGRLERQFTKADIPSSPETANIPDFSADVSLLYPPVASQGADRKTRITVAGISSSIAVTQFGIRLDIPVTIGVVIDGDFEVRQGKVKLSAELVDFWIASESGVAPGPAGAAFRLAARALAEVVANNASDLLDDIHVPEFDLSKAGLGNVKLRLDDADGHADEEAQKVGGQIEVVR